MTKMLLLVPLQVVPSCMVAQLEAALPKDPAARVRPGAPLPACCAVRACSGHAWQ